MKSQWRQKYQEREWMTRVDISLVYQMEKEAEALQQLASELIDRRIQKIADRFTYLLAVASGKIAQVNLSASLMPEDKTVKIPDPRLSLKK